MSTAASAVIAKARYDLNDRDAVDANRRWLDAELLGLLNDGQVVIVQNKPSANATTTQISLVEGPRQTLPAAGIFLVSISANVAGTTRGTTPSLIALKLLTSILPGWQSATSNAVVEFVGYDPEDPKVFWTYPPQPTSTTQKLETIHSAVPTAVAAVGNNISLGDEYVPALIDYIVYRAFAKDTEVAAAVERSNRALSGFAAKLGVPVERLKL